MVAGWTYNAAKSPGGTPLPGYQMMAAARNTPGGKSNGRVGFWVGLVLLAVGLGFIIGGILGAFEPAIPGFDFSQLF